MLYNNAYDGFKSITKIPLIVLTFNTPTYLKNTINFFQKYNQLEIVVLDNNSTYGPMIEYLEEISKEHIVIHQQHNYGPWQIHDDEVLYALLPEYFFITDPDLGFRQDFPSDFIETMKFLLDYSGQYKIGCALDWTITDKETILDDMFFMWGVHVTLRMLQSGIIDKQVAEYQGNPIYNDPVDTTFAMYKKSNKPQDRHICGIRIGGKYTVEHYGWEVVPPIPTEEYEYYKSTVSDASTSVKLQKDGRLDDEKSLHLVPDPLLWRHKSV